MELPLVSIGDENSVHDWNWLLLKFNVLAYDQTIGNVVLGMGVLIIATSVAFGFYASFERWEANALGRKRLSNVKRPAMIGKIKLSAFEALYRFVW